MKTIRIYTTEECIRSHDSFREIYPLSTSGKIDAYNYIHIDDTTIIIITNSFYDLEVYDMETQSVSDREVQ